ncbi:MAG: YkgJ family cysteine cluster protein [Candidatus Melainabacteria bacterium]|nr:YkgJ family cysteine cluster protein [Candidatus Melainabacteria bacterium]
MGNAPDSPLGLAKQVENLMKMPQRLCKQRGICCKVAPFKGLMQVDEIRALAQGDTIEAEMARDFLALFLPYNSLDEVRAIAPEFVERVQAQAVKGGRHPENIGLFHCRFVQADGRCGVHEDRPVGCRMYPFPHKNTIYHPGCGFEQQGKENWDKIKQILASLGMSEDDVS